MQLLSFIHILFFTMNLHPLHVSVTEMEFDEKDKRLEIMMRVFADDLELTLRNTYKKENFDILAANRQELDGMMSAYIEKHFKISLDKKPQKLNYLGYQHEDDAFVFYIEGPHKSKWKEIEVFNDMLIETHEDQSNLVHVTVKETVKSLRLTKSNPFGAISFNIR